jgi:hypothetical protein
MLKNIAGLKPPDATHIASAIIANVDEMHTFDEKILNLNGQIDKLDGNKLKIIKPDMTAAMPLLDEAEKSLSDSASESGEVSDIDRLFSPYSEKESRDAEAQDGSQEAAS